LALEVGGWGFYVRLMKQISIWLVALGLLASAPLRAEDAATEERLNKLSGRLENLEEAQQALKTQMQSLSAEVRKLSEEISKPSPTYAGQDDLKRLKDAVQEVDRKRMEDYEKIQAGLKKLAGLAAGEPGSGHGHKPPPAADPGPAANSPPPDGKGFEYTIQAKDTLSVIVQAYKEKNIKVTTDQILKANPGLKPEKLRVGQKIFIPAPPS
jgi:hypothetical protein